MLIELFLNYLIVCFNIQYLSPQSRKMRTCWAEEKRKKKCCHFSK